MRRTQLFISPMAPTASFIEPIKNMAHGDTTHLRINKPAGGLWTSTRTDIGRSAWTDWVNAEMPDWFDETQRAWSLEIKPKGVRLFVVTSHEDIARLPRNTASPSVAWPRQGVTAIPPIDFEALSQDFDGIRIINPHIGWSLFRDWSIESTLWFKWCFRNVQEEPLSRTPRRTWAD